MSEDNSSAATKKTGDNFVIRITRKLQSRIISEACPFCNNINWFLIDRETMAGILEFTENRKLTTYTLACTNCGFVRQHLRAVVDGEIIGEVSYDPK